MSDISKLTLTEIVKGIKKKEFSSEEVTNSFIKNPLFNGGLNIYKGAITHKAVANAFNLENPFMLLRPPKGLWIPLSW